MANPQKEAGHIRIANDLWEALIKIRIPGEARQCLDFIIRKTWGFGKKEDQIPLSQFCEATGMTKTHAANSLAKLKKMNLIFITEKNNYKGNLYKFNKDFDTWKPLPKKGTTQPYPKKGIPRTRKQVQSVPEYGNKSYPNTGTSITNKAIIKTTLKNNGPTPPEQDPKIINDLLNFFKQTVNPNLKFNNKTERQACTDLIKSYGLVKTKQALFFLQERRKVDQYLPLVTTPYELWVKWAKIKQRLETTIQTKPKRSIKL